MINPTAEFFESLIGQDLKVAGANGAELWRVVSVTRHRAHALRSDQPFNLYFDAPASNDRKQGIRSCVLPGGETMDLFVVPIAATADAVSFETVFN